MSLRSLFYRMALGKFLYLCVLQLLHLPTCYMVIFMHQLYWDNRCPYICLNIILGMSVWGLFLNLFICLWIHSCCSTIFWKILHFLYYVAFAALSKNSWFMWVHLLAQILSHWQLSLLFCQYHIILITVSLKSRSVNPLT